MTTTDQRAPTNAPAKPLFERVVETLATALGESVGWLAESGVLFAVFGVIWLAIGAMIAFSPATIDDLWRTIGALPLFVQILAWVMFLPVMAGLWVWEATWPELFRLAIVLALAGWTLLIFKPKWLRLPGSRESSVSQEN